MFYLLQIQVKSGSDGYGSEKRRLCGDTLPRSITGDRDEVLWIRFKSDGTTSRTGFSFYYKNI